MTLPTMLMKSIPRAPQDVVDPIVAAANARYAAAASNARLKELDRDRQGIDNARSVHPAALAAAVAKAGATISPVVARVPGAPTPMGFRNPAPVPVDASIAARQATIDTEQSRARLRQGVPAVGDPGLAQAAQFVQLDPMQAGKAPQPELPVMDSSLRKAAAVRARGEAPIDTVDGYVAELRKCRVPGDVAQVLDRITDPVIEAQARTGAARTLHPAQGR